MVSEPGSMKMLTKKKIGNFWKKRKIKKAREGSRSKALREDGSHLSDLYRTSVAHMTPVTAPIGLISQIQRSGGSLLSQLFDGHREVYAHPDELMIGYPKKSIWPAIDLTARPEQWFDILFEDNVIDHFKAGYTKGKKSDSTYPFLFLASLQKKLFVAYLASIESVTLRDVFDAYMTSYFGAWLNHQGSSSPKKLVTGFTPRLSVVAENMQQFFEIYPDGKLISVVRDPRNWFPSAFRHGSGKYTDVQSAMSQWNESALAMIRNSETYEERVAVLRFEDLVDKTEPVMRFLAEFLEIEFDEILLEPTFNRLPMAANTSFDAEKSGVVTSGTLERYKTLSQEQLDSIEAASGEIYRQTLKAAVVVD
jgi:hypothetical protein